MKNENILIIIILFILSSATCEEPKKNAEQKVKNLLDSARVFSTYKGVLIDSIFNYGMSLLNKAEQIDRHNYQIFYYKYFYCRNAQKYDSALIFLKKAIDLHPFDPYLYTSLAYLTEFKGDSLAAYSFFRKSLQIFDKLSSTQGKEFYYAKSKIYLIDILYGKDSALKYYDLMKRKFKIFDIDSNFKKDIIIFDKKILIKNEFR